MITRLLALGLIAFCLQAQQTVRVRVYGDSIDGGFHTPGAAVHVTDVGLPCNPNCAPYGSPSSYMALAAAQLQRQGVNLTWNNYSVVGQKVAGQAAPLCPHGQYTFDIVIIGWGANDLATAVTPNAFETNISNMWAKAKQNGCMVIARTITPGKSNVSDITIRQAANGFIRANYVKSAVALLDIGGDLQMGCTNCDQFGFTLADGTTSTLFSPLDCEPACVQGSKLSHWSGDGHAYVSNMYVLPALKTLLGLP